MMFISPQINKNPEIQYQLPKIEASIGNGYMQYDFPQVNHQELQQQYQLQQQKDIPTFEVLKKKIWEWQFMISTRRKWTYTEHDFEHVGITITGNPDEDMQSMETWTNTTRTLADLVEFYDQGKEFILRYPQDAQTIFLIIQEYTDFVAMKLQNSIHTLYYQVKENDNVKKVINDIIKMQNLANKLFPIALQNVERRTPTRGLLGFLGERSNTQGLSAIRFDPLEKFGIRLEDLQNMDNVDEQTGYYNAVDIRRHFDPQVMSTLKGVF